MPTAGYNFCVLGIGSNHDLLGERLIEPGLQLTPAHLSLHVVLLLQGCAEVVDSGVIAESLPNGGRCFIQREVVTGGTLKQAQRAIKFRDHDLGVLAKALQNDCPRYL